MDPERYSPTERTFIFVICFILGCILLGAICDKARVDERRRITNASWGE